MDKKKAIINIGGSFLQIPGIKWAKELGLHVVLTDLNQEAGGRRYADDFKKISGTDIPNLLQLAENLNNDFQLVGIYGSSDFSLPAVSIISEKFNLPACSPIALKKSLNKSLAKNIWQKSNVPTPKGKIVNTVEEYKEVSKEI